MRYLHTIDPLFDVTIRFRYEYAMKDEDIREGDGDDWRRVCERCFRFYLPQYKYFMVSRARKMNVCGEERYY